VSTDRSNLEDREDFSDDFINLLCNMLQKLTKHHFIAKSQNQYLRELKASLKPNECIIILDFAENFSFIVQDAAQSFHWNNAQSTLHPFVVYYIDQNNSDLRHKAFACISDHMTHDTVAVFTFLQKLINDYIKPLNQNIDKINYFSDGSCAQYKNYKSFANLVHHKQDFGFTAEWNFYATSHGKNSCDGVGGTVKHLATRASLQRPLDDQILTPHQLFQFARDNISGIASFFIDTNTVVKTTGETLEDLITI